MAVVEAAVVVAVAAKAFGAPAFTVLDTFGGFARLVRRTPTLDGSVPLRVAQGCVPVLEGNAFGHQVVIDRPLRLQARLGRWRAVGPAAAELERARRVALPMLRARGLLPRDGWLELERGAVLTEHGTLRIWTGLCVRPAPGTWLWIQSAANRRNVLFDIAERVVPDPDRLVPLVLELRPTPGVRELDLRGEVACVAALQPGAGVERLALRERPEIGDAHLRFYAQDYFEAKKRGEVTRRYRRTIDASAPSREGEGACEVAQLGPCPGASEAFAACLLAHGPAAAVPGHFGTMQRHRFDAMIDFTVAWDGHSVVVDCDRQRLRELAGALERAFDPSVMQTHPGALLYMTKYFTPHPAGEPHFFVKPWALTRTPPGWSCVVDGVHGRGYDVMRGVVHTDQFHATPAVFALREPGRRIEIAAGTPLLRVTPIPRRLLAVECRTEVLTGVGRMQ